MRLSAASLLLLLTSAQAIGEVKVGSPAVEIQLDLLLPNQPPENASLHALAGKAVVIEFWATWCAPCIEAIPHINELIEQFRGRPVQFLSVTDEDHSAVEGFLKKKAIDGWVGFDGKGLMKKAYGLDGIPATVLIDANGKVAGIAHPNQLKASLIEDLLAGKALPLPAMPASSMMTVSRGDRQSGPPPLLDIFIRPASSDNTSFRNSGSKVEAQGSNLRGLLSFAYGLPATRIEGDAVSDGSRYDVLVSGPKGMDWKTVLRDALSAAFQIRATTETRETEVLILRAPNGKPQGLKETVSTHGGSSSSSRNGRLVFINCSMSSLASSIQSALGRPVVDETEIKDRFDLELKWNPQDRESVLGVVKELGLAVEGGRRPLEYLVIKKL